MNGESPAFVSEPWGFVLSHKHGTGSVGVSTITGSGSPVVFTPANQELRWAGSAGAGPPASLSFLWDGKLMQSWHLPAGHKRGQGEADLHQNWRLTGTTMEGVLVQQQVLARPSSGEIQPDESATRQETFIDWLVHVFQELGQDHPEAEDAVAGGVIRRTWTRVSRAWFDPDRREPRIELIIRLAQDAALQRTLESISHNPRRILLRVREQTSISRVREMDAACIRMYARLPGRDAIQKAGTRQELLAVQRRASHDTLENRVTCWTMEALQARADRWRILHGKAARGSQRAKAVASLAKHAANYRTGENLVEIRTSGLSHPVAANYPLMMDPRYQRIYRAYRDLLKYDSILDDAWTWRRVVWSEAVTQLVSCSLRRTTQIQFESSPYFRTEPDRGRWTVAPAAAGPFQTREGLVHVLDVHDFEQFRPQLERGKFPRGSMQPVLERIGALGCGLALWWPQSGRAVPIWSVLWTGSSDAWSAALARAAESMEHLAVRMALEGVTSSRMRGLVVGTSAANDSVQIECARYRSATIVGVSVPLGIDNLDGNAFQAAFSRFDTAIMQIVDPSP